MSLSLLSATDRKRALHRKERRNGKRMIAAELKLLNEQLIDEPLKNFTDEAVGYFESIEYALIAEKRRRTDILAGVNPDTGESYTLKEFEVAVENIGDLTFEERKTAHATWFNIEYFSNLDREIQRELEELDAKNSI